MTDSGRARQRLLSSLVVLAATLLPEVAPATLVGPGDLMFIRFNADGFDDFAIVLLADAEAGQAVSFNTAAYHSQFGFGSGQHFVWDVDVALPAGTVVTFSDIGMVGGLPVVSDGSIRNPVTRIMSLVGVDDTIFAYLGTDEDDADTFLAAITTDSASVLSHSGLVIGETAIVLPADIDEAHYVGDRDSQMSFNDYRLLIGNVAANWQVRTTDLGMLPAFDTSDFELDEPVATTPESPLVAAMGLLMTLVVLVLRGHCCRSAIATGDA